MPLDNLLADNQSYAGTLELLAFMQALEHAKDALMKLRLDAQAVVFDRDAPTTVRLPSRPHVDAQRRDEGDKLRAQQILNENQAAKERQDFLEKQIAEEQQTLAVVGAWQQSVKVTPTTYTRP